MSAEKISRRCRWFGHYWSDPRPAGSLRCEPVYVGRLYVVCERSGCTARRDYPAGAIVTRGWST